MMNIYTHVYEVSIDLLHSIYFSTVAILFDPLIWVTYQLKYLIIGSIPYMKFNLLCGV